LVLFVSVFSAGIAAQTHHHTQTRIIDGRENPEQIPDSVARRLFFYNITAPGKPTGADVLQQAGKLKKIGLGEEDTKNLTRELATFRAQFDAEIASYNRQVEAAPAAAPYNVTSRLDGVVQDFRSRLAAPILAALERRMWSEKVNMKMSTDTGYPGTGTIVMVSQYSSYSTNIGASNALGSLQIGLSETLQGNASCQYLTGGSAPCPACTHTGTSTTIFDGGNTWTPIGDYPGLADGTSLAQLTSATDGTLAAINQYGAAYLFGSNGAWSKMQSQPPGTIENLSAGSASNVWAATSSGTYLYHPASATWTLNKAIIYLTYRANHAIFRAWKASRHFNKPSSTFRTSTTAAS
jgi:hypothetical protein